MALRSGHGTGAGQPRIEVLPPDEQPVGVQAPPAGGTSPEQHANGTLKKGAKRIPSMGGKARAKKAQTEAKIARFAAKLAIGQFGDPNAQFKPFLEQWERWTKQKCIELARDVGGGRCSAGVAAIVRNAGWSLAWAAYINELCACPFHWEKTIYEGRPKSDRPQLNLMLITAAARLSTEARQALLCAHELCARESQARPRDSFVDPQAALRARFGILGGGGKDDPR